MVKSTMAMAEDASQRLLLAPTFQPDVDVLIREGIAVFGVKGSGKSNLVSLLVEQLSRFFLPQVIFDTESEYTSLVEFLPRGVLATAGHLPKAAAILEHGLQVVVDLKSFDCEDSAAIAMTNLVWGLLHAAEKQDPTDRIPCIVHLDESAFWLPQRSVEYLCKSNRDDLLDAFAILASRGRKYGLTPFLYTQQISQVHKNAIRQAGILVLMRQSFDTDLKRYGEYVPLTVERKEQIRAFAPGKAVVILPDGSCPLVQFNERATMHTSHTPKAMRAVAKFAQTDCSYSLPTEPEPASNVVFLTKQGKKLERVQPAQERGSDIRAKVLRKVADFQANGQVPTVRDLERYLKSCPAQQLTQAVQALVKTGHLLPVKSGKTTRYTLAEQGERQA